jgi:hypothetical protein
MNNNESQLRAYFAFESELWSEVRNAELCLNQLKPHGDRPVLKHGGGMSPDNHRAINPSVIYDGKKFTMWYSGLHLNKSSSFKDYRTIKHFMCAAYSNDGITWRKPNLKRNIPEFEKSKNVLFSGGLLGGVDYLPELGKYAMALSFANGRKKEGGQTTFSLITSENGLDWEISHTPSITHEHFETCTGPKKMNGCYWVIGQGIFPHFHLPNGDKCGRSVFGFYSHDLKTWKLYPYPLFYYPPEIEFLKRNHNLGFQTHLGFTAWNRGRINLGMVGQLWPGGFSQNVRFTLGLIYSHDGLNWHEPFPKTPVLAADESTWFHNVIQGNSFYQTEKETLFWFSGGDDQGNTWEASCDIGLAAIRRDGFAHFEAEKTGKSYIVSEPVTLEKADETIYLNAVASPQNPLKVKLLDKYFEPVNNAEFVLSQSGVMEKCAIDLKKIMEQTKEIRISFEWEGSSEENRIYMFNIGPDVNPLNN